MAPLPLSLAGSPGLRWALVVLLALGLSRAACRPSPPDPRRGILVFYGELAGHDRAQWQWLDLATGESGPLGYEGSHYVSYIADRRAVWMTMAGEKWLETNGVVRIARGERELDTHAIRDVAIASVSPDGAHAAMASHYPVRPDDELYLGHFTGTRFEPDEGLGVPFTNTTVHGWFDTRTALVSGPDDVLRRVSPGKPPVTVRVVPDARVLGVASHDMTRFAWTTVSADDRWVLHIASLRDKRAPEQTVELGKGFLAYCEFAPGDRTLGCEVAQAMPLGLRAMLVDVKTGRRTELDDNVDPFVFSPDGTHVVSHGPELTLVPIDGKTAPISLGRKGAPFAWIR